MSVNKNLSKLALNVNANGDVTEAGLSATYTSNAYAGGTFATNTFVRDTFTSNNYVDTQLSNRDTAIGLRATNTFVKSTFTSNNYSQNFFANASNITSGILPSGRLSGTYSISISGSADRLDGKDSTDFTSNTYINSRNLSSNNYIQGRFTSNNFAKSTFTSNNYVDGRFVANNFIVGRYTSNNFVKTTFTSNNYVDGKFVSNNFFQDQSTPGTPSYSAYTGQTLAVAIGSANNTAYPARRYTDSTATYNYNSFSTSNETGVVSYKIADAGTNATTTNYIFKKLAGNDDFETAGVTFSSSNNSFTVADGYSVSITIGWQVNTEVHDGWRVTFSGAWSGTQDVMFEGEDGNNNVLWMRTPLIYTAKGPGLYNFATFTNQDAGTGAADDLHVAYVDVNAVYYNVSIS